MFSHGGHPLPSARQVRTALQKNARVQSKRFSMSMLHIGGFLTLDLLRTDSTSKYTLLLEILFSKSFPVLATLLL